MAYPSGFAGAPAPATPAAAAPSAPAAADHPAYAPVLTLAAILAHAAQLPQQQTIHENQAAADAAAHAQQQTIQGYTQALAKLLQGVAPQVQQGYQQAAQTEGALGSAFGGQLAAQGAPNQAQDQALLALSGGRANAGQVAAQTPGAALGNAAGWLGAGLPATGLNQAGAAFGAAASMLPGQVAGQGLQQIASIGARAQAADQGFGQKLDDLAAQYPGLLTKNTLALTPKPTTTSLQRFEAPDGSEWSFNPATGATTKLTSAYSKPVVRTYGNGGVMSIDPATGAVTITRQPDAKPEPAAKPYRYSDSFGREVQINPDGTQQVLSSGTYKDATGYYQVGLDGSLKKTSGADTSSTDPKVGAPPAGYKYNPATNRYEKVPGLPAAAKSGTGGLTQNQIKSTLTNWRDGKLTSVRVVAVDKKGETVRNDNGVPQYVTETQRVGQRPYFDAIRGLIGLGKTHAQAVRAVNGFYKPGENGRPYTGATARTVAAQFVRKAMQSGASADEILSRGLATGVIPRDVLEAALKQNYRKPNPVFGVGSDFTTPGAYGGGGNFPAA